MPSVNPGFVLWFTGLSGSGKSTLASMVAAELRRRAIHVETLDGDEIRKHLSKGLGFSREDRDTNIRRLGFVAKLVARSGGCAITAAISPYRQVRDEIRHDIERFCEVHCDCPISVLAERDPKGLYKKALRGEIKNFTGIDDPYEPPPSPEVHIHTDREPAEVSARRILERLESLGFIGPGSASDTSVGFPGALPAPHGGELSDRWLEGQDADAERDAAESLPSIALSPEQEVTVAGLALGTLSPLRGFMGGKDTLRVSREMRLEGGLVWPLPVVLAVPDGLVATLERARRAALRGSDGVLLATLEVAEVWYPETGARVPHVAGDVRVFRLPSAFTGGEHSGPRQVRAELRERGFGRVVALQSARAPHLSEEHAARSALELADGLVFLLRSDDAARGLLERRKRCYESLIQAALPASRTLVAPYPSAPFAGTARSLLLDAIVAKNYGASELIVSSDQVLDRDAFERALPVDALAELGVRVLPLGRAFYSEALRSVVTARTAPEATRALAVEAPDSLRPEIEALLDGHG